MRSKTLLVSNVLATLYCIYLLWSLIGSIAQAGGADFLRAMGAYFSFLFAIVGISNEMAVVLYLLVILLCVHIFVFVFGCLLGWIGYFSKSGGAAKFSAVLYLIGTICFPIYVVFGLPITIVAFNGAKNQKRIKAANA